MGVAYTSNGGGVYIQWGWRIHPMGVAYTSKGGGVYVQWTYTSKGPYFSGPEESPLSFCIMNQPGLPIFRYIVDLSNKKHSH